MSFFQLPSVGYGLDGFVDRNYPRTQRIPNLTQVGLNTPALHTIHLSVIYECGVTHFFLQYRLLDELE